MKLTGPALETVAAVEDGAVLGVELFVQDVERGVAGAVSLGEGFDDLGLADGEVIDVVAEFGGEGEEVGW